MKSCSKALRLALLFFFATCFATVNAETYELVTNTSSLEAGGKYLIVNTAAAKALGNQKTNNREAVDVIISNKEISNIGSATVLTLDGNATDGWTFYDSANSGYLYAAGSSYTDKKGKTKYNNYLKVESVLDDNGKASIEVSTDGTATITFKGSNECNKLNYNSNSKLFSCYFNEQQTVELYKLEENAKKCTTPTITESQSFLNSVEVSMSCATENSTIYYTTDDSDPSTSSSKQKYSSPFTITSTTTVKAIACADGLETSDIATATYTKVDALNGLAALKAKILEDNSTSDKTYYVNLTNAVVTKASSSDGSIEEGNVGILLFKSSHGYKAGDTFNGIAKVTAKTYNGYAELTNIEDIEATADDAPNPVIVTLADLNEKFDEYACRYVRLKDVNVSEISGLSITVTSGDNSIIAYKSSSSVTSPASDANVSVLGVVYPYYKKSGSQVKEVKVYQSDDFIDLGDDVTLTISPSGYSSLYYSDRNLALPEGVKGYVCSYTEGTSTIKAEEVYYKDNTSLNAVPKDCAVILEGTANTAYTLEAVDDDDVVFGKDCQTNILKGTDDKETIEKEDGKYIYFFGYDSNNNNTPGFFMSSDLTNYAHKAYIQISYDASAQGAKALVLDFGNGSTTSINSAATAESISDGKIFTIEGVQVNSKNLKPGLYIKNGRKFIVK